MPRPFVKETNDPNGERTCKYCAKVFVDRSTRNRHQKSQSCLNRMQHAPQSTHTLEELSRMVITLTAEVRMLQQQLAASNSNSNSGPQATAAPALVQNMTVNASNSVMDNRQINITNNNNTIINSYGKEDTSHISWDDKIRWARDPENGVLCYVHKKHFDPSKPENHNLKMASIKRKELKVHMNGAWQRMPARPFMGKVLEKAAYDLSNAIDWETLSKPSELWFEQIDDDVECKQGQKSVASLIYLVENHTKNPDAPPPIVNAVM